MTADTIAPNRRHVGVAFDHYVPRAPETFWKSMLNQWRTGLKRKVPEATVHIERCGQEVKRAYRAVTVICFYDVSNGRERVDLLDAMGTPVFEPIWRWAQMAPQEAIGSVGVIYEGAEREKPASCAAVLRGMLGHQWLKVQRSPLEVIINRFPSENRWLEEFFAHCMDPEDPTGLPLLPADRLPSDAERHDWHEFLRRQGPKVFDVVWGDNRWPKAPPEVIAFAEARRRKVLRAQR